MSISELISREDIDKTCFWNLSANIKIITEISVVTQGFGQICQAEPAQQGVTAFCATRVIVTFPEISPESGTSHWPLTSHRSCSTTQPVISPFDSSSCKSSSLTRDPLLDPIKCWGEAKCHLMFLWFQGRPWPCLVQQKPFGHTPSWLQVRRWDLS